MIVLIDNYDSFTFNLVHYLGELGADGRSCIATTRIAAEDVIAADPDAIVLSPGPCTPNEAGICLDLIAQGGADDPDLRRLPRPPGDRPGVRRRRGARARAGARQALGDPPRGPGRVPRHQRAVQGDALPFAGGRPRQPAGRRSRCTAETDDRLVMGLQHAELPVHGVQFHPESIASEHGHLILRNFLELAAPGTRRRAAAAKRTRSRRARRTGA